MITRVRSDLPSGTVTFLFTDVEGSTKLLHELGARAYADALAEHRRLIREACANEDGVEVDTQGDAFFFAFPTAPGALAAASAFTASLSSGPIRVRVGLHTGTPLLTEEGYVGDDVHVGARVASSGHGGQVILSSATAALVELPLIDLGEHRLKDIEQAVSIHQLGAGSFPPLKTISNTNLPRPASSFLGREEELREVLSRIEAGARLVTLSGPGGTGKTRLALEAAMSLVPSYKAGVFWVGLASLRDPTLVSETIAQVLGAKDALAEHIGERELLLLLDNLEQVVEAAPELASLLAACPNLTLLATSRELLRISGEVEYPVPPLASQEAVELFCARSQLQPSEEIAELCMRLDSLPLAVELAAARTRALTPTQITERLSGRLDLLKGGRDADPRQQTLRATIEWSYELLSAEEQELFASLSVFAGGCTLEAAEEVCGADLDTLQSLVEKNLLRFTASGADGRYWMLETIREYAGEQLGEEGGDAAPVATAYRAYFLGWVEDVAPRLRGPTQAEALGRVDAEYENLRDVLAGSFALAPRDALRIAAGLRRYWWVRASREGRLWLERLVPVARSFPLERAAFWVFVGSGALARERGDWQLAIERAEEGVTLARELGDPDLIAGTEHELAVSIDVAGGDPDRAREHYERALAGRRQIGDRVGVIQSLTGVGAVAQQQGATAEARAALTEALELARELGDKESIAATLGGVAELALDEDGHDLDLEWVLSSVYECLRLSRELGNPSWVCGCLDLLSRALVRAGSPHAAARILGASEAMREEVGVPLVPVEASAHEERRESLRHSLGIEEFERLHADGRSAPLDEVLHETAPD
jgi:predicted ATPase/class 3 adenylate cyclase